MTWTWSARDKAFVVVMCAALTFLTTNFAALATFFPVYGAQLGMSPYTISAVFTAYPIGKLATSPVAGWLASRYGRKPVLLCVINSKCG